MPASYDLMTGVSSVSAGFISALQNPVRVRPTFRCISASQFRIRDMTFSTSTLLLPLFALMYRRNKPLTSVLSMLFSSFMRFICSSIAPSSCWTLSSKQLICFSLNRSSFSCSSRRATCAMRSFSASRRPASTLDCSMSMSSLISPILLWISASRSVWNMSRTDCRLSTACSCCLTSLSLAVSCCVSVLISLAFSFSCSLKCSVSASLFSIIFALMSPFSFSSAFSCCSTVTWRLALFSFWVTSANSC
mmetsp:Transcript_54102/g.89275  ORF Transcript_54102/g.89275 Transcript_54102/m.89275 type:complete len:248 (+) Transcript_54102:637-1380(+)